MYNSISSSIDRGFEQSLIELPFGSLSLVPFFKLYQLYPHRTAAFLQVTLSVVTVGPPEAVAT